jgi:hypothetical protein
VIWRKTKICFKKEKVRLEVEEAQKSREKAMKEALADLSTLRKFTKKAKAH